MERTAAEIRISLRKKLIRLAFQDPSLRDSIAPLVERLSPQTRLAVSEDTSRFVSWVLSTQDPMRDSEVEAFVSRTLGIKTSPPVTRRSGPRFQRGDSVQILVDKHKDMKFDRGNYELYDGKIGTVTEVQEPLDVLVSFGSGAPVLFPGALSPKGVGIMKYTKPYTIEGSDKIELIYLAGGPTTSDAEVIVQKYLGGGRGSEKRSAHYYTGYVTFASTGQNGYYFQGFPQQRIQVGEAGYRPTTFSTGVGKILYIGKFGARPSKWKKELEELESEGE